MRAKNHIALSLAMSLLLTNLQAQEALSVEDPSHIQVEEQEEPQLDQEALPPIEQEEPPLDQEVLPSEEKEEPLSPVAATETTIPLIELPKKTSTTDLEAFWQAHNKTAPAGNEWYELAIAQIKAGNRADAETSLVKALATSPHSAATLTQLGFLFLWNSQDQKAYYYFDQALKNEPCYKPAVAGLIALAASWSQKSYSERTAYFTLERALQCDPKNADVLFYLGRLLAKWQCYKEAERYLIAALREAPDYSDAAVVLAGIYFQQKKLRAAEILYERFSDKNDDAKSGLARLSLYCQDPCRAKELYEDVVAKHPCDKDSGQGLARALAKLRCFCRAEQEYMWLIKHDPCNESLWRESFETRSHIKPRIWLESSYLQAKENDPSVGVPVVRDFYFREGLHLWMPLTEVWRLDLKQIYNSQKEDDIFPPTGVNYNVHQTGLQATSQYFFATDWRFDLSLRGFYASGSQNVFFPFDKTTRFEPGALFLYKSDYRMLALEGHTESFIIKNFSVNRSQLLMMNVVSAGYGVTPDWPFKPEVELWAG